jgi:hypothetical protein
MRCKNMATIQSITEGDINNEFLEEWTTEAVVDELAYRLCTFKIAAVACTLDFNKKNYDQYNENGNEIFVSNKYIKQAEQLIYRIPIWRPPPEFLVSLSDLTPRLRAELRQLLKAKSYKTVNYITQHALAVVFECVNERYFHLSIGIGQIRWRLVP